MLRFPAILLAMLLALPFNARSAENVRLWVYHNFPPFITDAVQEQGLSFDLARRLSEMSDGAFDFQVEILPRARINRNLKAGDGGLVLWTNPAWFGDAGRTNYLWSHGIMIDGYALISPSGSPILYQDLEASPPLQFAAVRGHRYVGIDELVERGAVNRVELPSEASLISFVAAGRANFGIVGRSLANYYANTSDDLFISGTPHDSFYRHVLISRSRPQLHQFINAAFKELIESRDWDAVLQGYGLSDAPVPETSG